MLRITRSTIGTRPAVVRLEGKLLGPWVTELQSLSDVADDEPLPQLDLSSLTYVDEAGLKLLRDFIARGGQIGSCSPFVAELLK